MPSAFMFTVATPEPGVVSVTTALIQLKHMLAMTIAVVEYDGPAVTVIEAFGLSDQFVGVKFALVELTPVGSLEY